MPVPTPHSDPVRYANRPLEPEFDEYLAVREHVARLVIQPVILKTNQLKSSAHG